MHLISVLTSNNNGRREIIESLSAREEEILSDLLARHLATREPLGSVGKGLLGTGVSLVGSSLASEAINEIESLFKKREPLGAVGKGLLGTGVSLVGSSLASEAINEIESHLKKREPLGSLGSSLLGTGVSLVGSSLASEAINDVESLFGREMSLNELD